MNLKAINTMIDSEAVSQNNTFSHSVNDYEKIYNYITDEEIETTKEDVENLIKKVSVLQRPIAEFVNACLVNINTPNNDLLLKGLIDKSIKAQKFDYSAYFSDVASRINPLNKYALNIKAVSLKKLDAPIEEQKEAIEKYLEQDLDDTKFLFELAELHKKEGKPKNAVIDLKKAVQRSIQKQDFHELKINTLELDTLLKEVNESKDYIVTTLSRGAKKIGPEKTNTLLFEIERRNSDEIEYSIKLLKEMLIIDPKNSKAKNVLIEQYKKLYNNSEHCIKCLEKSGLMQDVNTAIAMSITNFEKLIMFEEKAFVYHATHDIGRVAKVEPDSLIINFISKPNHKMSTDMALKSLTVLADDNIRVLKKFANKQKLHDKIIGDTRWALIRLIKSDDNNFKLMKKELVPEILTQAEFQAFLQEARKITRSDSYISPSPEKADEYIVRDTPISHEEKLYQKFKNETNIFEKMKIMRNFLQTEGDKESESFQRMLHYFQMFLKSKSSTINYNYVYSYLFLSELKRSKHRVKVATSTFPASDKEVFEAIPDGEIIDWYLNIQDNEICKSYIRMIIKSGESWRDILSDIFLKAPSAFISSEFKRMKENNFDADKKKQSIFIAKQNPAPFLYYLKNEQSFENWKDICKSEYEFITVQLDVLNTFSQKAVIANQITASLITSGYLEEFIKSTQTYLAPLYDLISMNKGIDDEKKANLKSIIFERLPEELKKEKRKGAEVSSIPTALLCKQSTYDKKKAELEHIMSVEIPKNAEDIGTARELGDLKENAEYQYAKEKQKLLNTAMNKLDDEISKAKVVRNEDIDETKVCYGTKISILNSDGTNQEYTILGPWESEPDNNIISFNSPLGKKLYNHTVGEEFNFSLNDHPYNFKITKITKIDVS